MAKKTIVILSILDDDEGRPWWDALCLPEPHRWNGVNLDGSDGAFAPHTHVKVVIDEVVVNG